MAALHFMVPRADKGEFGMLTVEVQTEISKLLRIIKRIHNAPKKERVLQIKIESAALGNGRGNSWRSVRRKYYAYKNSDGDWRTLINKAKTSNGKTPLNADFVEYFRGLCDNHKRSINSACDDLYARWYGGEEIPGYGRWQEYFATTEYYKFRPLPAKCPEDFPEGWSRGNLAKYKPSKTEQALTRRGIFAALETIPTCISTREGLKPFEYLVFDDAETDFLICETNSAQVCKVEGLFGKDVATDVWLQFGLRPGIKLPSGKKESLKRQDMLELAVQILTTYGYPRDYVSTWIVERGTATISEPDAAAIYEATNGHVVISRTGMINGKVLQEGYSDKAVGNFKGKPWVESGFNLLWNKLDHVRGQKGSHYRIQPMEVETRKKAATDILLAGKLLPAEVMLQEHLPFPTLHEAFHTVKDAMKRINARTNHKCESFKEEVFWRFIDCGVTEWQPYSKLLNLPVEVRDKVEIKKEMESPYSRMNRLNNNHGVVMETIHPSAIARILRDYHRKVKVDNGEIVINVDKKQLRFFDVDSPLCGNEGAEYIAYLPKGDYSEVYLTDGKGRYLGELPRRIGKKYGDKHNQHKQLANKRKALARKTRAINKRHKTEIAQAIEDTTQTLDTMERLDGYMLSREAEVGGTASTVVTQITESMAERKQAYKKADDQEARDVDLSEIAAGALMANAK